MAANYGRAQTPRNRRRFSGDTAKLHPGDIWTATNGPHVYRFEVRDACPQKSLIGGEMFDLVTGGAQREGCFVIDGDRPLPDWKLVSRVAPAEPDPVVIAFPRKTA